MNIMLEMLIMVEELARTTHIISITVMFGILGHWK
jgi:hypothetical protein